jgi:hypothetical protein
MSDEAIKDALNRMPYGFYSITSRSGDDVNAMVANWVIRTHLLRKRAAPFLRARPLTWSAASCT